jgi:hypothetical protein
MLILSSKKALQKQIGDIRPLEKTINENIASRDDYQILVCYYDEPDQCSIGPAEDDAQAIRDYVMRYEEKTGAVDFLLLLGGDEVVPFFRLDNPCDDADEEVLSDNPYASRDGNYIIPERVCARIPDGGSSAYMNKQLKKAKDTFHESFGLTAEVWQRASENVFRSVGDPEDLKISPPVTSATFKKEWLQGKDYLYFNIHGSKLSANWYGQGKGDYPIAMQPVHIERAAGIVASEACYGAYVIDKTKDNAISLRFLDEESVLGFCGSTTIAYGPAKPPSSEADLLVKYFFEYLVQGMTLGESFKNAKLDFARKALRRQGFLDDDDKKTLLQFVLYGDPTLRIRTEDGEEIV